MVKNLPANAEDLRGCGFNPWVQKILEEGMAAHSSILAWRIPMDRGAWWTTVHRVTKNLTQLKQLSTHAHLLLNCLPKDDRCLQLCSSPGSSVHGDSPGKNTGVGCHALLQGIFPTQGSNPRSPALQVDSSPPEPPGKPNQHQAPKLWF